MKLTDLTEAAPTIPEEYLTRFDPDQQLILRVLARNRMSPFGLAAYWWGGAHLNKPRGALRAPSGPDADLARTAYLSAGDDGPGRLFALLCSVCLWEILFPGEFPGRPVLAYLVGEGFSEMDPADRQDWARTHLDPASPLRGLMSSDLTRDCVRIGELRF